LNWIAGTATTLHTHAAVRSEALALTQELLHENQVRR
jgi:hypothetical protein